MKHSGAKAQYAICAALFAILLGSDQLTKWLAVQNLRGQAAYVVLPGVLEFFYWENTGAAFSSFQGMNTLLLVVNIVLMAALCVAFFRISPAPRWRPLRFGMVVLVAGGLGNVIDRVARGFVVDFIYFVPINFPKFNLADSYIVVSIVWLFLLVMFRYKEDEILDAFRRNRNKHTN